MRIAIKLDAPRTCICTRFHMRANKRIQNTARIHRRALQSHTYTHSTGRGLANCWCCQLTKHTHTHIQTHHGQRTRMFLGFLRRLGNQYWHDLHMIVGCIHHPYSTCKLELQGLLGDSLERSEVILLSSYGGLPAVRCYTYLVIKYFNETQHRKRRIASLQRMLCERRGMHRI